MQKYVTRGTELSDTHYGHKIKHAADHYAIYQKHVSGDLAGRRVLEIGTGWYPIVPLYFYLKGAENITTIDIAPLCTATYVKIAAERMLADQQVHKYLPERAQKLRDSLELNDISEIFKALDITYIIGDVSTHHSDQPYDFICSNNTLEHV